MTGTYFDRDIPQDLQDVIEKLRRSKVRVRIILGDVRAGVPYPHDRRKTGTIARSPGTMRVPILIPNVNSYGGEEICCWAILAIRSARKRGGEWFYKHPTYKGDD